jgi:hypothetical protein
MSKMQRTGREAGSDVQLPETLKGDFEAASGGNPGKKGPVTAREYVQSPLSLNKYVVVWSLRRAIKAE